jgi:hypothetical protein
MTFEQVVAMQKSLSNWGRWGKQDERGTLNLVTAGENEAGAGVGKGWHCGVARTFCDP